MRPIHVPSRLTLQWHITERCNLRCAHCYREEPSAEMSLDRCRIVLGQFVSLLAEIAAVRAQRTPGHINVTGGEPFAVPWFFDVLEELAKARPHLSFAILTNGTLITPSVADRLKALAPGFVQVSIDGSVLTHDRLRGEGSRAAALEGLTHLVRHGIRTLIAFTAHAANYRDFPDVAALARRLKVSRLWVDRLVPVGRGREMHGQSLTPDQTLELFELVNNERRRSRSSRTEIAMHRALQFLVAGTKPYRCRAGDELVALMPDGEMLPCRRLPLRAGNVFEASLRDVYFTSPVLEDLRNPAAMSGDCEPCFYRRVCGGGLRCLAHAVYGDPHRTDPGCWLAARRGRVATASAV